MNKTRQTKACKSLIFVAMASLLAMSGACGDERDRQWDESRYVEGPIYLKNRLLYLDSARDTAVVVDLTRAEPALRMFDTCREPFSASPLKGREQILIMCRGQRAVYKGEVDQEPSIQLLNFESEDIESKIFVTGSPFDRAAVSHDGSVALAYYSPQAISEELFTNPNEIAIIHLDEEAGDNNPAVKTIRSFGTVPEGVVFAPPMAISQDPSGRDRTLAYVLARDTLTIFDADAPDRREISLRLDTGDADLLPREMVFVPGASTAYLRSENARDIFEISLSYQEETTGSDDDNDFRAVISEVGAGGTPADIAVYDDADGVRRVIAVTPSMSEVVLIDAASTQFRRIATPESVDRVWLFPSGEDQQPKLALFASLSRQSSQLYTLKLDDLANPLVPAKVETIELERGVVDLVPVPAQDSALIVHDDSRTIMGLLELGLGTVAPVRGLGRLDSYDFSSDGAYLVGLSQSVAAVGVLDLANLHPHDLPLNDLPESVRITDNGKVIIDHGDPLGRLTVLPHVDADRQESLVLSGFLLSNYLDEEY